MIQLFPIKFPNHHQAQAVKLDQFQELDSAIRQLGIEYPKPTLVLIGGAAGLTGENLIRPFFSDVVVPVMTEVGGILIDGGTDSGIMKLIGQAYLEQGATFPLIGVSASGTIVLPNQASPDPEKASLEPNHTHFMLVPGVNWGDEAPWLAEVANVLAGDSASVAMLINGGEFSRKDVQYNLKGGRSILIMAGTGRLADELAQQPKVSHLFHILNINEAPRHSKEILKSLLAEESR